MVVIVVLVAREIVEERTGFRVELVGQEPRVNMVSIRAHSDDVTFEYAGLLRGSGSCRDCDTIELQRRTNEETSSLVNSERCEFVRRDVNALKLGIINERVGRVKFSAITSWLPRPESSFFSTLP